MRHRAAFSMALLAVVLGNAAVLATPVSPFILTRTDASDGIRYSAFSYLFGTLVPNEHRKAMRPNELKEFIRIVKMQMGPNAPFAILIAPDSPLRRALDSIHDLRQAGAEIAYLLVDTGGKLSERDFKRVWFCDSLVPHEFNDNCCVVVPADRSAQRSKEHDFIILKGKKQLEPAPPANPRPGSVR